MLFFSSNPFYDNCRNSRALAYGLIFIVNKRADLQIYNLCDASTRTTILLVKKQIEVSFSCVCSTHTHTWVFILFCQHQNTQDLCYWPWSDIDIQMGYLHSTRQDLFFFSAGLSSAEYECCFKMCLKMLFSALVQPFLR